MTKKNEANEEEVKKAEEEKSDTIGENPESESEEPKEETAPKEPKEEPKSKEEESFETKYLRMAADFQNFKRRTEEEKTRIYTNANERFGCDLLEVLDNFERAIEQDRKNEADEQFIKGMEMILKQLKDVLKKNGIEEIECLGTEFDPNFHHAVAMDSSEEYDKGCVMDVMQKGYKLKDKVIRPAMVRVAE